MGRRPRSRPGRGSTLVEDLLGDLALADLAPLPLVAADILVEVLLGDPDGPEPDLGLVLARLLELGASGEVQEIGPGLDRRLLGPLHGEGPVEDVADRPQSHL